MGCCLDVENGLFGLVVEGKELSLFVVGVSVMVRILKGNGLEGNNMISCLVCEGMVCFLFALMISRKGVVSAKVFNLLTVAVARSLSVSVYML